MIFASATMSLSRGEMIQCFSASLLRTAEERFDFRIHPRLRFAHLGLLRCSLFEAMM